MLSQMTTMNEVVMIATHYLERCKIMSTVPTLALEVSRCRNTLFTIDVTLRLHFTRRDAIRCTLAVSAAPKVAARVHEDPNPCAYCSCGVRLHDMWWHAGHSLTSGEPRSSCYIVITKGIHFQKLLVCPWQRMGVYIVSIDITSGNTHIMREFLGPVNWRP
jgi:hypothetical protein